MKIANATNNRIDTNYGSNWLYYSDNPINTKDYYFEIQVSDYSTYSSGCFGFIGKINGNFHSSGYSYYPSFVFCLYPYEQIEWCTIYYKTASIKETRLKRYFPSYFLNKRIGLRLTKINDSLLYRIYLEGEFIYSADPINITSTIDITDFYIGAFNQWDHNQITAQFFFDEDCKYWCKYLVENSENKIYKTDTDNSIQLISESKFEDLDKDQKTNLFTNATFYCNLHDFKSLAQPIKIIKNNLI